MWSSWGRRSFISHKIPPSFSIFHRFCALSFPPQMIPMTIKKIKTDFIYSEFPFNTPREFLLFFLVTLPFLRNFSFWFSVSNPDGPYLITHKTPSGCISPIPTFLYSLYILRLDCNLLHFSEITLVYLSSFSYPPVLQ